MSEFIDYEVVDEDQHLTSSDTEGESTNTHSDADDEGMSVEEEEPTEEDRAFVASEGEVEEEPEPEPEQEQEEEEEVEIRPSRRSDVSKKEQRNVRDRERRRLRKLEHDEEREASYESPGEKKRRLKEERLAERDAAADTLDHRQVFHEQELRRDEELVSRLISKHGSMSSTRNVETTHIECDERALSGLPNPLRRSSSSQPIAYHEQPHSPMDEDNNTWSSHSSMSGGGGDSRRFQAVNSGRNDSSSSSRESIPVPTPTPKPKAKPQLKPVEVTSRSSKLILHNPTLLSSKHSTSSPKPTEWSPQDRFTFFEKGRPNQAYGIVDLHIAPTTRDGEIDLKRCSQQHYSTCVMCNKPEDDIDSYDLFLFSSDRAVAPIKVDKTLALTIQDKHKASLTPSAWIKHKNLVIKNKNRVLNEWGEIHSLMMHPVLYQEMEEQKKDERSVKASHAKLIQRDDFSFLANGVAIQALRRAFIARTQLTPPNRVMDTAREAEEMFTSWSTSEGSDLMTKFLLYNQDTTKHRLTMQDLFTYLLNMLPFFDVDCRVALCKRAQEVPQPTSNKRKTVGSSSHAKTNPKKRRT
jgi:hypothetical protein